MLNKWLRLTGKESTPAVTYTGDTADPAFSCTIPEGFVLDNYMERGELYASATYHCPERGESAYISFMCYYDGGSGLTIDHEDLSVYEELTLGGRLVIYQEKEGDESMQGSFCNAWVSVQDPLCLVSILAYDVTREEMLAMAESLEVRPLCAS